MFDTLCKLVPADNDYPQRVRKLTILNQVMEGTLYDAFPYHFHEERSSTGEYVPLRQRRPSVRYPLCRIVVEDSVSLLFSEGHFPTIDCANPAVRATLADIVKETQLNLTMTQAAMSGASGSVALLVRVLKGRLFVDVLDTMYLTPTWDPTAPATLARVDERYKVSVSDLLRNGYAIDDPDGQYWFARCWDNEGETWFEPAPINDSLPPVIDAVRSVLHQLGAVPIVWIKNLPGTPSTGDSADGACTFAAAMHTQVEIDYQLSQAQLPQLTPGSV
jgi:hypothetical protein